MAGAALLGRLTWLVGEVVETAQETPRVRTLVLDAEGWESTVRVSTWTCG